MPRKKSEDSTSVCLKCLRANVLFPDPEGPIRTTRDSSGMVIFISQKLPFAWANRLRHRRARLAKSGQCIRTFPPLSLPRIRTRPATIRNDDLYDADFLLANSQSVCCTQHSES